MTISNFSADCIFSSIFNQIYFKGAVGAILVFDVIRLSTLENAKFWKSDLDSEVVLSNGQLLPAVLLANKVSKKNRKGNLIRLQIAL